MTFASLVNPGYQEIDKICRAKQEPAISVLLLSTAIKSTDALV